MERGDGGGGDVGRKCSIRVSNVYRRGIAAGRGETHELSLVGRLSWIAEAEELKYLVRERGAGVISKTESGLLSPSYERA